MSILKYSILLIGLCSCANVKQIDRGVLSHRTMQPSTLAQEKKFIYQARTYREGAASGASSVAGAGCGCQ